MYNADNFVMYLCIYKNCKSIYEISNYLKFSLFRSNFNSLLLEADDNCTKLRLALSQALLCVHYDVLTFTNSSNTIGEHIELYIN